MLHKYLQEQGKCVYRKANTSGMYYVEPAQVVQVGEYAVIEWPDNAKCVKDFKPVYTPQQMIKAGIFGGMYFGSGKEDTLYPIGRERMLLLPQEWFSADVYMSDTRPSWKTNKFGVGAGLDRSWWMQRKLISDCDPLGWFEWYCHFFLGRRLPFEDTHQIMRWVSFRERHTAMAIQGGLSPRYRQSLFQWAVDPYPDRTEGVL